MKTGMKSKKIFLAMAFFASCLPGKVTAQSLVVWQKDGTKVIYSLDERPKTTFADANLVITTKSVTLTHSLSEVQRYTYIDIHSAGISNAYESDITFQQQGSNIVLKGLPLGCPVRVYAADGRLLQSHRSDSRNQMTVSLSRYPSGTYIISANRLNCKFQKP
ncbi:MAG: hypothetical protein IJ614_04825 [Prevotella sp.]|nr:hypothetical protein [Prevotella sp.]